VFPPHHHHHFLATAGVAKYRLQIALTMPTFASSVLGVCKIILVVAAVSLVSFTYKRALFPLYGSVPVLKYLNYVFVASMIIPVGLPSIGIPRLSTVNNIGILGALICLIPKGVYYVGSYTARQGDPLLGPIITHLTVFAPAILVGSSAVLGVEVSSTDDSQYPFV
jgi:hypothetical protein